MKKETLTKSVRFDKNEWQSIEQILKKSQIDFSSLVRNMLTKSSLLSALAYLEQEKENKEIGELKSRAIKDLTFQLRAIGYNILKIKDELEPNYSSKELNNIMLVISDTNETLKNLYELLKIINENLDFAQMDTRIANLESIRQGENYRQERKSNVI